MELNQMNSYIVEVQLSDGNWERLSGYAPRSYEKTYQLIQFYRFMFNDLSYRIKEFKVSF